MPAKNTGKASEEIFDDVWTRYGKTAFCFKFTDAAEATGMNKKRITIKAQPCDRLLVVEGNVEFAEVKSTVDTRNFPFTLLRPSQGAYAAFVLAAGGQYNVYVHSLHLNRWFKVPYSFIRQTKEAGRASLSWVELLKDFAWTPPVMTA